MENNEYSNIAASRSLCENVQMDIQELIEGGMSSEESQRIHAHIKVCIFCARVWREMLETVRLLENLPVMEMKENLTPGIMSTIERKVKKDAGIPWWKRWIS